MVKSELKLMNLLLQLFFFVASRPWPWTIYVSRLKQEFVSCSHYLQSHDLLQCNLTLEMEMKYFQPAADLKRWKGDWRYTRLGCWPSTFPVNCELPNLLNFKYLHGSLKAVPLQWNWAKTVAGLPHTDYS